MELMQSFFRKRDPPIATSSTLSAQIKTRESESKSLSSTSLLGTTKVWLDRARSNWVPEKYPDYEADVDDTGVRFNSWFKERLEDWKFNYDSSKNIPVVKSAIQMNLKMSDAYVWKTSSRVWHHLSIEELNDLNNAIRSDSELGHIIESSMTTTSPPRNVLQSSQIVSEENDNDDSNDIGNKNLPEKEEEKTNDDHNFDQSEENDEDTHFDASEEEIKTSKSLSDDASISTLSASPKHKISSSISSSISPDTESSPGTTATISPSPTMDPTSKIADENTKDNDNKTTVEGKLSSMLTVASTVVKSSSTKFFKWTLDPKNRRTIAIIGIIAVSSYWYGKRRGRKERTASLTLFSTHPDMQRLHYPHLSHGSQQPQIQPPPGPTSSYQRFLDQSQQYQYPSSSTQPQSMSYSSGSPHSYSPQSDNPYSSQPFTHNSHPYSSDMTG
jgi:hypothetical protein